MRFKGLDLNLLVTLDVLIELRSDWLTASRKLPGPESRKLVT